MTQSLKYAGILGTGSFLPPQVVTNDDLARRMDTSDEWISTRTGIRARRIASPEVATSDLALEAATRALENARLTPADLDLVVVATCTPDHPGSFPSTAAIVQNRIGAVRAGAFDLGAVCSGFTYSLHVVAQMIATGAAHKALVIGAETLSRITNWNDRNTAVLFGDGAGAVVLGQFDEPGYLGGRLWADGSGGHLLNVPAGGSRTPLSPDCIETGANCIYQNGKEVYKFAVTKMVEAVLQTLEHLGLGPTDVDLLVPHQANVRIIASAAERMGLPMEKVFVNLDKYGNTSAATIPIALDEAARSGVLRKGSLVVTVGFGGGLTWAANVIRW